MLLGQVFIPRPGGSRQGDGSPGPVMGLSPFQRDDHSVDKPTRGSVTVGPLSIR